MNITQITSITDKSHLQIMYNKVFNSNDPFGQIFSDEIPHRLLVCTIPSPYLDEELLRAVTCAARFVGDEYFYISEVEGRSIHTFLDENHWKLKIDVTYDEYSRTTPPILFENAIYSPNGSWGILVAHDDFAVIGGNEIFISTIKENYAKWKSGLDMFLKKWAFNVNHHIGNLCWLPTFLEHLKIHHHFK